MTDLPLLDVNETSFDEYVFALLYGNNVAKMGAAMQPASATVQASNDSHSASEHPALRYSRSELLF